MKQFVNKILIFSILLIMINGLFYLIVLKFYYNDYHKINLNYHTYILSDSHGLQLKNTENYGVYNFSAAGDSYFDMYIKLRFLLNNTDLKKILITVDDHTLSKYRESANNLDRSAFYIGLADQSSLFEYIRVKYLKNYIVLLNPGGRSIVRAFFRSKILGSSKNDLAPKWPDLSQNERIENSIKRATEQFPTDQHSSSLAEALDDIINLCKKSKVELVGIKYPLSPEYINAIANKNCQADSIFYLNGLKVYDYKNLFLKQDVFFFDPNHLNESGGKEFVRILAEKAFQSL